MDYQSANEYLTQGHNKNQKKLAGNTYIRREGEEIIIRFHDTDIITFFPGGDIMLDTRGHRTPTTKTRLNKYLSAHVFQRDYRWYIKDSGKTCLFRDGMILKNGKLTGNPCRVKKDKYTKSLEKRIKKYVDNIAFPLEKPSGGDCWHCHMVKDNGEMMGHNDKDHLLDHLREGYVVPSLIFNVIKKAGYGEVYFYAAFTGNETPLFLRNNIKDLVAKYLKTQLIPN